MENPNLLPWVVITVLGLCALAYFLQSTGWWRDLRDAHRYHRQLQAIPADLRVMHALRSGELYPVDISEEYGVGLGTVHGILTGFEREGWVECLMEGQHGRTAYLLTSMGQQQLHRFYRLPGWHRLDVLKGWP